MRICRYDNDRVGIVEGDAVLDVTDVVMAQLPPLRWPLLSGDTLIARLGELRPLLEKATSGAERRPLGSVRLLSPVANPVRVIAAPLNYALHVQESVDPAINPGVHLPGFEGYRTPIDKMGLFLKSHTGVVGAGEGVQIHFPGRRNDHEVELAVVIGRHGKSISRSAALDYVAGYCIGLDITVRGTEDRSFRKSADSYTVLGPWLVTADEVVDPGRLDLSISVDGEQRQRSSTSQLLVDIPDLIALASSVYALHPGDVIMTGTPEGVAPIYPGNTMVAAIERIGAMEVRVR